MPPKKTTGRTTPPADKPIPLDHLRSQKKASTASTWLVQDLDKLDEFENLENQVVEARKRFGMFPGLEGTLEELNRLEDELKQAAEELRHPDVSIKFVFRSIGAKAYEDLVTAHPLSDEKKEELKSKGIDPDALAFDADTFAPALVAASCISHELTYEFVKDEIMGDDSGDWSQSDIKSLYSAALEANTRQRDVNLGKDFSLTRRS